jgi:hypothetical protein
MIRAVREVVHNGANPKKAFDLYKTLSAEKKKKG